MLLLSLVLWYIRRADPISFHDLQRMTAVVVMVVCLFPMELSVSECKALEPPTKQPHVLREGTRIPPTTGKIVMVGRRWGIRANNDVERTGRSRTRADHGTARVLDDRSTSPSYTSWQLRTRLRVESIQDCGNRN